MRVGVTEGSWFHQTECFGPVLGVMRADDLDHAIRMQNGTPYGLTGGIQSLDDHEVDQWLGRVEVGNAYVNRHITGAIVRRQPFGGWKRSSIGGAPKAGGPHYVHALLHPEAAVIDVAAAVASYESAWAEHFATGHDFTGLRSESNVLRHVPVGHVLVRVGATRRPAPLDASTRAAATAGVRVTVSDAAIESDDALATRIGDIGPERFRALTAIGDDLARACHARDITVDRAPVSPNGLLELPHWLREQAISRTLHRYGSVPARRPASRRAVGEREALVARGGDGVAVLAVEVEAADVGEEDPRLAGDVGTHVPAVGPRVERHVADLGDVVDPAVLGRHGCLDRDLALIPHRDHAVGDPLDVLLDRHHHVAQDGRAARAGDHEQVRKAGDRQPEVVARAVCHLSRSSTPPTPVGLNASSGPVSASNPIARTSSSTS